MKETLDSKKNDIDHGIRCRQYVSYGFKALFGIFSRRKKISSTRGQSDTLASDRSGFSSDEDVTFSTCHVRRESEETLLLSPDIRDNERLSEDYRYRQRSSSLSALVRPVIPEADQSPSPRFSDILTKQVVINMVVYSGLALHSISFDQLFPLLCSTKIQDGGMGMAAGQIGAALSVSGVMAMILQLTLFPWGHNKFGGLLCLRTVLGMYAVLYFVLSSTKFH